MKYRQLTGTQSIRFYGRPFCHHYIIEDDKLKIVDLDYRGKDFRPNRRWHVNAILRSDNRAVLLDIGPMLFGDIRTLVCYDHGDDPLYYDLDIDLSAGKILSIKYISNIRNAMDSEIIMKAPLKIEKIHSYLKYEIDVPKDYNLEIDAARVSEINFHKCNDECFSHHGPGMNIQYSYQIYEVSVK